MITPDEEPLASPRRAGSSPRPEDRSVGELFAELANDTSALVRKEVQLASKEMSMKATYAARQGAFIGGGLLLGVVALLSLIAALIFGLATMISLWKSALLVGVLVGVAAGLFVWKGAAALRKMNVLPTQTLQSIKEDEQWVREQMR